MKEYLKDYRKIQSSHIFKKLIDFKCAEVDVVTRMKFIKDEVEISVDDVNVDADDKQDNSIGLRQNMHILAMKYLAVDNVGCWNTISSLLKVYFFPWYEKRAGEIIFKIWRC